jgi:hypothetical protein
VRSRDEATSHDVARHDEVVQPYATTRHLAEVDPRVGRLDDSYAIDLDDRAPLETPVADASGAADPRSCGVAHDVQVRPVVHELTGQRQVQQPGRSHVGERDVRGQGSREGGDPGAKAVGLGPAANSSGGDVEAGGS